MVLPSSAIKIRGKSYNFINMDNILINNFFSEFRIKKKNKDFDPATDVFIIDAKPDKTLKFVVGTYGYRIPSYKVY